MMKRNIILVGAIALLLSACASAPSKTAKNEPQLAQVEASYSDKITAVALEQVKSHPACPTDGKWESLPWQKVGVLANACVKAKDWMKVEKMGDWLARNAHLTPWGPYYLSLSAESRRDYPRATWMLELALKKAPKEGLFHYELGRIHWELKEDALAVKELQAAADLNPSLTGAQWVLGQLAMQRGDYPNADRYLQKAISSDAEHSPSLLAMAQLKVLTKDWDKAETYLMRAISANPHGTRARVALAQVQELNLKKYEEALRTYKAIKQMLSEHKLDEPVPFNLDEKIQALQKSLAQASNPAKRRPADAGHSGVVVKDSQGKVHE